MDTKQIHFTEGPSLHELLASLTREALDIRVRGMNKVSILMHEAARFRTHDGKSFFILIDSIERVGTDGVNWAFTGSIIQETSVIEDTWVECHGEIFIHKNASIGWIRKSFKDAIMTSERSERLITSGPSLFGLMKSVSRRGIVFDGLLDLKHQIFMCNVVTFRLESGKVVHVLVDTLQRESGDGKQWNFYGHIIQEGNTPTDGWETIVGHFSITQRRGWLATL